MPVQTLAICGPLVTTSQTAFSSVFSLLQNVFNRQACNMRDNKQLLGGPQALFAGLSKKLDDARGLIDSAIPRGRWAARVQTLQGH